MRDDRVEMIRRLRAWLRLSWPCKIGRHHWIDRLDTFYPIVGSPKPHTIDVCRWQSCAHCPASKDFRVVVSRPIRSVGKRRRA